MLTKVLNQNILNISFDNKSKNQHLVKDISGCKFKLLVEISLKLIFYLLTISEEK